MPRWVPTDPWFWIGAAMLCGAFGIALWVGVWACLAVGLAALGMVVWAGWDETGRQ